MCPQEIRPRPSYAASWAVDQAMSEDCLILNVWTPALRDHHKRPVMVWFHGGGFSTGSGSNPVYDGTNLARKGDVVVVTVNHRLNIFGHLYLARVGGTEFAESGNLGVLDLIAALRWIHVNIAEFGGDPANVTIFGQSGGGAKVSVLMAMPPTRGLFHRAIVQSGSRLDGLTSDEANANTLAFLKAADIPPADLARLQKMTLAQLMAALRKAMRAPGTPLDFSPVVDGKFLERAPWIPDNEDRNHRVDRRRRSLGFFVGRCEPAQKFGGVDSRQRDRSGDRGIPEVGAGGVTVRPVFRHHECTPGASTGLGAGGAQSGTERRTGMVVRTRLANSGRRREMEIAAWARSGFRIR
jgi:carboxylesterase type B